MSRWDDVAIIKIIVNDMTRLFCGFRCCLEARFGDHNRLKAQETVNKLQFHAHNRSAQSLIQEVYGQMTFSCICYRCFAYIAGIKYPRENFNETHAYHYKKLSVLWIPKNPSNIHDDVFFIFQISPNLIYQTIASLLYYCASSGHRNAAKTFWWMFLNLDKIFLGNFVNVTYVAQNFYLPLSIQTVVRLVHTKVCTLDSKRFLLHYLRYRWTSWWENKYFELLFFLS